MPLYGRTQQDDEENQPPGPGGVQQPIQALGGQANQGSAPLAAQSPFANYEDIYNMNKNYGARAATATENQVTQPLYNAGLQGRSLQNANTPSQQGVKANAAPANKVLPQAPTPRATGNLVGIQKSSDLLKGYGQDQGTSNHFGNTTQQGLDSTQTKPDDTAAPAADPNDPATIAAKAQQDALAQFEQNVASGQSLDDMTNNAYNQDPNQFNQTVTSINNGTYVDPTKVDPGAEAKYQADQLDPTKDAGVASAQAKLDAMNRAQAGLDQATADDAAKTKQEAANEDKYKTAADQLAAYNSDSGLSLMQQKDPQADAWDAAFMNQAGGRSAFAGLEKQYGGYDQTYGKNIAANENARQDAITTQKAQLGLLQGADTELTGAQQDAANKKQAAEDAADKQLASEKSGKAQGDLDYEHANDATLGGALRYVGEQADPAGRLLAGFGNGSSDSPVSDTVTDAFEKSTGAPLGDTSANGTYKGVPIGIARGMSKQEWEEYDAMTPDEQAAFIQSKKAGK